MEEGIELPESKGTSAGKVLQWIFVLGSALGVVTQYVHPEWLADATTEAVIHEDVEHLKDDVKTELLLEFKDVMAKAKSEHTSVKSSLIRANKRILQLEEQHKAYDELVIAHQKQMDFNTLMGSITNEAVIEEMDKKSGDCNYTYYETNHKDNWGIFDDWYNSRVLYSLELKSDCRVYYTPIFREKVKVQ